MLSIVASLLLAPFYGAGIFAIYLCHAGATHPFLTLASVTAFFTFMVGMMVR